MAKKVRSSSGLVSGSVTAAGGNVVVVSGAERQAARLKVKADKRAGRKTSTTISAVAEAKPREVTTAPPEHASEMVPTEEAIIALRDVGITVPEDWQVTSWVVPTREGDWEVRTGLLAGVLAHYETQAEATARAKSIITEAGSSEVETYGPSGRTLDSGAREWVKDRRTNPD